jgi:hypothetical protein
MSTLSPDQHDRYLEVLNAANNLFGGDFDAALHWMSRPLTAFGGKAPAAMVATRVETDAVIELIRRLETGLLLSKAGQHPGACGSPTLSMHTTSKLPRFSIRQHRLGRPK